MDVIVNAVATLGPHLALILAHMDTADLNAGNHAVGRIRMHAKTPHVTSLHRAM
ncbi:hypothetical protein HYG81_25935 (plasmid) [Natrinema zhouii]|uniref:hypothetical protein n=1 Tax=Natrinema zhouii TaxID=1710539 RepID=UPI001CFFE24E|nr:hypothetical protein [Natrinema zhouii]UHQ99277.1 hypothetical protein HYG81_25935 [Natrinema zhouii]